MSFLKFRPGKKSKDISRELKGPYVPLETIDLEYSIAAIANNLVLNCKSCKSHGSVSGKDEEEAPDKFHCFSGFVGVISKGSFLIYQLDVKLHQEFIYKHVHTVCIAHPPSSSHRPLVTGAKWIRLKKANNKMTVLVLTSTVGVYIYSEDGNKILCTHEHLEVAADTICRNVAATQSQVFVGNGRGEVHTFSFLDGKVEFRTTAVIQPESITQICCRRGVLVTGSPTGTVRVWKIKEHKATKRCCFTTPSEECVTGLGIWESYIIATYGSGVFRIFHWTSKRLVARVFAHSRWIVGLDLLPHQGLLLTVAEDDAVLIWKLSCSKEVDSRLSLKGLGSIKNIKKKIKNMQRCCKSKRRKPKVSVVLDSTIQTENMMLVGGKFLNCMGSAVALANYGVREIYFYGKMLFPDEQFNA